MTLISSTRFFNGALLAGAMALISTEVAVAQPAPGTADSSGRLVQTWDKTFPRSEKVDHQKVTFKNRYGITLAADVYLPKDRGNKKLAALVISGPFGAVKEQASGLYAQTLAERGFVTLAFDPSYTGESSGEPRNIASPDINTEDFMAAVDFMGLQPYVDRERIGVIGICGMGGIALNAVAVDKRVKAVVASTMYDMSRVMSKGYNDSVTPEQREQALEKMSLQRWEDAANGKPAYQPAYNKLKGGEAQFLVDYADYYMTKRGYHPRAVNSGNSWSVTTPMAFMNFPLMTYIKEISPRPILFIHGEKAHSLYFSKTLAHLLKYDSLLGKLDAEVPAGEGGLVVYGKPITVFSERNPASIPWRQCEVDIVIEATGLFTDREKAAVHIHSGGAKRVIISAPGKNDDLTIVMGVNESLYSPDKHYVISNGSCTTNGLAPAAQVLHQHFGIKHGLMNTTHAYTNSQALHDQPEKDLRGARAAALSIVPYSSGAAKALGKVIPELDGRLTGYSLRVPVPVVSIVDLTVTLERDVTVEEVNNAFREAAAAGPLKGILGYSDEPLVSSDYQGDPRSSIIDGLSTLVIGGNMVKILAWYDNEWGFSNRLVDLALMMAKRES